MTAPSRPDTAPEDILDRAAIEGLRGRVARGAAVVLLGQWGRFVLNLGGTVVLARLLTPDDYGLVAMVTAVTAFADRFRSLGLSEATIQRAHLTQRQVSALFWINTGCGVLLCLAVAAVGPLLARFYGRQELTAVTVALAVTFVFSGVSVQHQAVLTRRMRFTSLTVIELVSMFVATVSAVAAAALGAGYWALVVWQIATHLTRMVLSVRLSGWRPERPRRGSDTKPLLVFGGHLSATNLLNYFSRNLDNVLIGRTQGSAELGLYARAYNILLLPLQQVNAPIASVAVSTLSLLQDDEDRYRRYYRGAISVIAFISMPAIGLAAVLSSEIIEMVLGSRWLGAAPLFQILAFASIAQTISNTNQWVYVSTGQTGRMVRFALFSRPLVVIAFVVGLPWGARGVALAYTIEQWLVLVPSFAYAVRGTPLQLLDVVRAAWRPLLLTAGVVVVGFRAHGWMTPGDAPAVLGGTAGVVLLAVCVALAVWPGARSQLREVANVLRSAMRPRRGRGGVVV